MDKANPITFDGRCSNVSGYYIDTNHMASQLGCNRLNRPEKLDTWFYMAMKEMRRNSYMDLIESWDISEEEANEVEKYIEEKLGVKL